jgi:hypothetical protein
MPKQSGKKTRIASKARERAKVVMPHLKRKIQDMEMLLGKLENDQSIDTDEKIFMMAKPEPAHH